MIDLDTVTIEGPDLAGKTTLYSHIHKMSGYKWNIQDRSVLSMLCYSIFYNRGDDDIWRARLTDSIDNLNNRTIVLLPEWNLLLDRFNSRGDEIQTLETLKRIHEIFEEEASKIEEYATVLVLRPGSEDDFASDVRTALSWLSATENYLLEDVAREIAQNAKASPGLECSPLRFRLDYENPASDPSILAHEAEEAYYANILKNVLTNVRDEMEGNNEYGIPQEPHSTRRFIYTQDSCISLIHTMLRNDVMNIHVVCRSSDTVNTFLYDLKFLYYLSSRILRRVGIDHKLCGLSTKCRLHVTLNSAHIIKE